MRDDTDISRRTALGLVGSGLAGGGLVGTVVGAEEGDDSERVRVNAGYRSEAGRRAIDDRAAVVFYDHPTDILTARMSRAAVRRLRSRPDVRFVERDVEMEAIDQTTPYGIRKVDATEAHADGDTAAGADVAVIDTGIDSRHPDLTGNLGEGRAFTAGVGTPAWDDANGHGTHVAGTVGAIDDDEGVIGVGPDVTLHAVKALNASGAGLVSDIAAAIEWTADRGYEVGNLSLGGGSTSTLREACRYAQEKGTLLVAAAGNDGPCSGCVTAPARYPECMAVSATDENDDLASFSSTGPEVEIAAPGDDVYSTYYLQSYATLSGTSMAAPHVAGGDESGAGRLDVDAALGALRRRR
ncbi:peptidase S8 [Halobacteriales archaeon QS_9_70_65]|nr:MAG: peptidase S8 [Halobacteriales archaeon QS_9_70_65]